MRNRWAWAALLLAALLLGAAAWFLRRSGQAAPPSPAQAVATPQAQEAARAASPSLEAAIRAMMPGAGLFREDWLRKDGDSWNLKIPRRRDAKALAALIQAGLESSGPKPTLFENRDFPQWRGFYLEAGGEKLVAVQDKAPALALVIDDWGYHTKVLPQMKAFPGRLTVAVLPGLPYSKECAEAAFEAGHEVILHLPVEPERSMPMLPGTLMVGMSAEEVDGWLDKHALSVPHMLGLNNHEGSKGSADPALMRTVASWLRAHGGYLLDSKTSPASVAEAEARRAGIPYASRRVFLDNVDQPAAIEKAARLALSIALKSGACIAIGHPRENTMAVLTRLAPEFEDQGVDLVRVSELTFFDLGASSLVASHD
jgi:polysaccharide deacetylase 2 family uncharacterized protein YibQ